MAVSEDAAVMAAATLAAAIVTGQQHKNGVQSMTTDEASAYVGKLFDTMLARVKKPTGRAGTMMISEPTV